MEKNIFFIAGIHGVGKSTFCSQISQEFKIKHYSASDLIKATLKGAINTNKRVNNVSDNQDILIHAIKTLVPEKSILLDGHFCLINKQENIEKISIQTFDALQPKAVLLLHDGVNEIVKRLNSRDSLIHNEVIFTQLNTKEDQHCRYVCNHLNLPLYFQKTGTINHDFINQLKSTLR